MSKDTIVTKNIRPKVSATIDDFIQQGAQRMLLTALQAEVDEYIQRHQSERDENGHALY